MLTSEIIALERRFNGRPDYDGFDSVSAGIDLYLGLTPDVLMIPFDPRDPRSPLVPDPAQVKPNLTETICRQGSFFEWAGGHDYMIHPPGIKAGEVLTPEQEAFLESLEDCIIKCLGGPDMPARLLTAGEWKAAAGHVFFEMRVSTGPDGETMVDTVLVDPRQIRRFHDPHNVRVPTCYRIFYPIPDPLDKKKLVNFHKVIERFTKDDGTYGWTITEEISRDSDPKDTGWTTYHPTGIEPVWDFEFPPILDAQNLPSIMSMGKPDIASAIGQKWIHFSGSAISKILRYHAGPKLVITNAKPSVITSSTDSVIFAEGEDGKAVDVKLLEMQGDIGASTKWHENLNSGFFRDAGAVDYRPELTMQASSTSNMRLLHVGIDAKTHVKHELMRGLLIEHARRVWHICGMVDYHDEGWKISITFAKVTPTNDIEQQAMGAADVRLGALSLKSYRSMRGYNPDEESLIKGEVAAYAALYGSPFTHPSLIAAASVIPAGSAGGAPELPPALDANGQPMLDENGQPMVMGPDGQPMSKPAPMPSMGPGTPKMPGQPNQPQLTSGAPAPSKADPNAVLNRMLAALETMPDGKTGGPGKGPRAYAGSGAPPAGAK